MFSKPAALENWVWLFIDAPNSRHGLSPQGLAGSLDEFVQTLRNMGVAVEKTKGGTRIEYTFTLAAKPLIPYKNWQRLVSGIRHAAVHRLSQDHESLLRMNRVAIEFFICIGGLSRVDKLRRLLEFLENRLPKSERRRT
ncbi:hypothetical protein PCH_Pc16g14960 [Penicillium rubens Wisconsin 54-1255]|uniref:Uncharacterized protein n=1 Tax=Penicillium rubens (strain ATCC 28089 / DSM 1075 / NRRL 1951 / Wisconsin 54-1255) TaxID=500485 RepID=B6HA42_PENRW|nr:hypothetical protein N7534_008267 [Penicillium rubens]CAP94166.1 hypothetical protein PCH_Pc16g14960 [Penicillium rubens Wisconsin 54-1255]